jgi:DnaJ-class molecular chaperone
MKTRETARAERSARCARCDGWAFEPDVVPMKACSACGGTGKPRGLTNG